MDVLTQLHALAGPWALAGLIALAAAAGLAASMGRSPGALEWGRRLGLAVLVAQAAIGLAMAARGLRPGEGIHWLYGVAIVLALLVPGALPADVTARRRATTLALGSALAAVFAWRLWGSG